MKLKFVGALLLTSVAFNAAYAEDGHSDIGFEVHDGAIELTIGEHDHDHGEEDGHDEHEGEAHKQAYSTDGKAIFEANFGDFSGGPFATKNPGYAAAAGDLPSGTVFAFQGLGKLSFWNGSAWTNDTSSAVSISDAWSNVSTWNASGYTAGQSSFLGESSANGGFHEHITYSIDNGAAVGAYMIQLQIADVNGAFTPSDSFYLVFNRGLSEQAYEASISALTSEVPVPAAAWLFMSALLGLGAAKRK